jgi:phage tail-like protein
MPILGTPRTFHKKFKFVIEIDQFSSAGFQKCSELSVEVANIEYHEGGSLIPNKSPGRLKFADVTLERGATRDHELFDWFSDVADAAANAGLVEPVFKRNVDIVQQDRDGTTPAALVAQRRLADQVRRRRLGQRGRRERDRERHPDLQLLHADLR